MRTRDGYWMLNEIENRRTGTTDVMEPIIECLNQQDIRHLEEIIYTFFRIEFQFTFKIMKVAMLSPK